MKPFHKLLALLLVALTVVTVSAWASGDDPLIALSYLNDVFMPKVENKIRESNSFTVVTVPGGKFFVAGEGCEFILRSGSAYIVASKNGGICDTTDGKDLAQDTVAPINHLLIAPRSDGRGFWAANTVTLMVKGAYSVQ